MRQTAQERDEGTAVDWANWRARIHACVRATHCTRSHSCSRCLSACLPVPALRVSVTAVSLSSAACVVVQGYLLMLLEKEQSNESERVRLLAAIDNVGDQRRLEKIFAIERAKAAAVIKAVTREHERALALKMEQLGLIEDDDDDEHFQPQQQHQQRQQQQQTDYSRRR